MSTTFAGTCPHCKIKKQGFTSRGSYTSDFRAMNLFPAYGNTQVVREFITFECNHCHGPLVIEFYRYHHVPQIFASKQPLNINEETKSFDEKYIVVFAKHPKVENDDQAPDFTPENIASFFAQASRSLIAGDSDSAGMTFRKALDSATRRLIRDLNPSNLEAVLRRNLKSRIEFLHENGKLTEDLRDWAHFIRDDGNDAAHEEDPYSQDEARQLSEFTEVFLTYVFTLPEKIRLKRGDSAE